MYGPYTVIECATFESPPTGSVARLGVLPPPTCLPEMPLISHGSGHHLELEALAAAAAASHPNATSSTLQSSTGQLVPPLVLSGYDPKAALPPKLVKRILALEYVEMAELLPDAWPEENTETGPQHRRTRHPPVTDILTWLECFASMAAVLSTRYPEKVAEFWAYQTSILRAARNFDGAAWVAYDRQYRREALARRDLNWSACNTRLYNEAFTGRAKTIPRCQHCLSTTHSTRLCPTNPDPSASHGTPQTSHPSSVLAASTGSSTRREICRNYNEGRCKYSRCRYLHICRECFYPHPWVSCHSSQAPPQRPRSPRRPRNRDPSFNN